MTDLLNAQRLKQMLYLSGEVTPEKIEKLTRELFVNLDPSRVVNPTTLVLTNCVAGSSGAALSWYDTIRIAKVDLVTIAVGNLDATGLIMFLSGNNRIVGPNASFRLSELGARGTNNWFSLSELEAIVNDLTQDTETYASIISTMTGSTLDVETVQEMMRDHISISPTRAFELGLATHEPEK